jgi:hypothetical protein
LSSTRSIENDRLSRRRPRGAELTPAGTPLSHAHHDANLTSAENELRGLRDQPHRADRSA